ncbi:MAG: helix-turn-helix domain-containing protein [Planctomycetota bacterium]
MVKKATTADGQPAPAAHDGIAAMFEECIGCKWTLHVLAQIRTGVHRPGALVRSEPGLTTKVLNERLVKLVRYGVLEKRSFAEIPPRVEYHLTAFGARFLELLDGIDDLRRQFPQ